MYPIIYTPTEAQAISEYSHLFRRPEGLFLTPDHEDKMEEMFVDACEGRELELVCASPAKSPLLSGQTVSGVELMGLDRRLGWRGNSGDRGSSESTSAFLCYLHVALNAAV